MKKRVFFILIPFLSIFIIAISFLTTEITSDYKNILKVDTNEYTITFNLEGGSFKEPPPFELTDLDNIFKYKPSGTEQQLPIPEKTNFKFIGWTGSNGDIPSKDVKMGKWEQGNKEYTAHWTALNPTLLKGSTFNSRLKTLSNLNNTQFIEFKLIDSFDNIEGEYVDLSLDQDKSVLGYCDGDKTIIASTSKIKSNSDCTGMFKGLTTIKSINTDNLNMSGIISLEEFCQGMSSLENINFVKNLDLSNLQQGYRSKGVYYAFKDCTSLTDISALSTWNLSNSNINSLIGILQGCTSLTDITPLSNWDTSNIKEFNAIFYDCTSLKNINPVGNWNTGKLEDCHSIFRNTAVVDARIIDNWRVPKSVIYAGMCMFYDCKDLVYIPTFKYWDFRNGGVAYYFSLLYYNCTNIQGSFTVTTSRNLEDEIQIGDMFSKNLKNTIRINYLPGCATAAQQLVKANNNPKVILGSQISALSYETIIDEETKAVAQNMINTKSSDSNIILGELVTE